MANLPAPKAKNQKPKQPTSKASGRFLRRIFDTLIPPLQADFALQAGLNTILARERERILTGLLRVVIVLGFITLLTIIPAVIRDGQWFLFGVFWFCFILIAFVTVNRRLTYRLRAFTFLATIYSVGLLDLLNFGLAEDGRLFLFSFSVAAIIVLGRQIGTIALGLSVGTIGLVGWLISTGRFTIFEQSNIPAGELTLETVIISCLVFLMMAGLVMAALHALLRSFQIAWRQERVAANSLQEERNLLEVRVAERTRELAQARDHALSASRLKTEIVAKVSHDLRTPLSAILGFTEMLDMGHFGPTSDAQHQAFLEIVDSVKYQTRLIDGLLDQAQLDAGRLQLHIASFAPAEIVEGSLANLRLLAANKNLALKTEIAPELPASLSGDLTRLQQILVNLVSNAIKFTDSGQIQITLYQVDGYHWAMRVADTGLGIPAEAHQQIFEPFGQVDGSITRHHQGSGLGLSIVKQLTELMGGQIELESQPGQGSIFTATFPLDPPPENN